MTCHHCGHDSDLHTLFAGCVAGVDNVFCICTRFLPAHPSLGQPPAAFAHDGVTYDPAVDARPLNRQQQAVYALMTDGQWRCLATISQTLGFPEASVSARLRDLRKAKWGGHDVQRQRRPDSAGTPTRLWEYRLDLIPQEQTP